MIRGILPGLAAGALLVAFALDGLAPFGRVALIFGADRAAARLFADAEWRGVALARAGAYGAAAQAFAAVAGGAYNQGTTLARAGQYARALEALDAAEAANAADHQAAANFDLVAAYYSGTLIAADTPVTWGNDGTGETQAASIGKGSARAAGTGDEITNTGATMGVPEVDSKGDRQVRKVFDQKFIIASPRWLTTLDDVPGAYLAARIAAEHKRRKKAGLSPPEPEVPW